MKLTSYPSGTQNFGVVLEFWKICSHLQITITNTMLEYINCDEIYQL
jgi:hypothetical protein